MADVESNTNGVGPEDSQEFNLSPWRAAAALPAMVVLRLARSDGRQPLRRDRRVLLPHRILVWGVIMSDKSQITWMCPTQSHGARWKGFLMSNFDNSSRRRQAKCTHCEQVFNEARPHQLFAHIKDKCQSISALERIQYLQDAVSNATGLFSSESDDIPTLGPCKSHLFIDSSPISNIPQKRPRGASSSDHSCLPPFTVEEMQKLHELILTACLTSNIPLDFLDNPYFQQYQEGLAQSLPYELPLRTQITQTALPMLHAKHEMEIMNEVRNQKGLTLSLDGWTDVSGNTIYTVLLSRGDHLKHFIDILELTGKRHTAENFYEAVSECLLKKSLKMSTISAVVTDSSSLMAGFQALMTTEHPHIIPTHCVLHVFNLIAKNFISHPSMGHIIKGNKTLVNYFNSSPFWNKEITNWAKENAISPNLSTVCKTRWYSLAKVCLAVQSHQEGFKKCLQTFYNPLSDTPVISKEVVDVIEKSDHFTSNHALASLLQPLVDSIAQLEQPNTNLTDVWKELYTLYTTINAIQLDDLYLPFKQDCINILHQRSLTFNDEIYFIAFFLHPAYRQIAVSCKYSLKDITLMILKLAKKWKYSRSEAELIPIQVERYYGQQYPYRYHSPSKFPNKALNYWAEIPEFQELCPLKRLAMMVLEIVPHATGVESLFSLISATNTKARNRMLPSTLKMVSQIKLHILQKALRSQTSQSEESCPKFLHDTPLAIDQISDDDLFNSTNDLETFEEGVFSLENLAVDAFPDTFLDSLFDSTMWGQVDQKPSAFDEQQCNRAPEEDTDWHPDQFFV
ncbi:hypothetical protein O181_031404 [Austropuccinia psidii MF-1]|uniref:DUF659 domain-containing protein n=1 Tax=Austropuccinia psidii MF-1 TaxID=1389203 RepID=A0A9Q3CVN0_9BASI|nr:hypothetical protein [Austropuccinia psidii MF-1]